MEKLGAFMVQIFPAFWKKMGSIHLKEQVCCGVLFDQKLSNKNKNNKIREIERKIACARTQS